MSLITKDKADQIALKYLCQVESEIGLPLAIIHSETLERPSFWVYFYNSKEYSDTGDFKSMLLGNAPFFVRKKEGDIVVTGTVKDIQCYINEFEEKHDC